jgi:hypothetical protein
MRDRPPGEAIGLWGGNIRSVSAYVKQAPIATRDGDHWEPVERSSLFPLRKPNPENGVQEVVDSNPIAPTSLHRADPALRRFLGWNLPVLAGFRFSRQPPHRSRLLVEAGAKMSSLCRRIVRRDDACRCPK